MIGKNSPENILKKIIKLEPIEFIGICKVLGVKLYEIGIVSKDGVEIEQTRPREFTDVWSDLCDKVGSLNRTRRRNLARLVNAATSKED
jgi:hypothetical protein